MKGVSKPIYLFTSDVTPCEVESEESVFLLADNAEAEAVLKNESKMFGSGEGSFLPLSFT